MGQRTIKRRLIPAVMLAFLVLTLQSSALCAPTVTTATRAVCSGNIQGDRLELVWTIDVEVPADGWTRIDLPGGEWELAKGALPEGASLLSGPHGKFIVFEKAGNFSVALRTGTAVQTEGAASTAVIPVLNAAICQIELLLKGEKLELQTADDIVTKSKAEKGQTRISVFPKAAGELPLTWIDTELRERLKPTIIASQKCVCTFDNGEAIIEAWIELTAQEGRMDKVRIPVPDGWSPVSVRGTAVRDWLGGESAGRKFVEVVISTEGIKNAIVELKLERPIGNLPALIAVAPLEVEGAKSHTGIIGLSAETGLNLCEKKIDGAQRAEPAALREAFRQAADGLTFGYAFNGLPCGVTVEVSKAQARLTERSEYLIIVDRGVAILVCRSFITVEHVGVTSLSFAVPDGFSVSAVEAKNSCGWKVESGVLTVTFVKPVIGTVDLTISGEPSMAGEVLVVPPIRLKGAQDSESLIAFATTKDVMIEASEVTNLAQVPAVNMPKWMPRGEFKLAYSTAAPEWKLSVRVRPASPEVRASVNAICAFSNDRISQEVFATFNVTRTEAFSFELSVPAGWTVLEVTSGNIREWSQEAGIVRVFPALPVLGRFDVRLVIEKGFAKNDASVELSGVVPRSVLDTTGSVRFCSGEDVEVNALSTDGLQVMAMEKMRTLPETSGKTRFAYSITKAEWVATVSVKQVQPEFDASTVSFVRARQGQLTVWTVIEMETTGIGSNRFVLRLPKWAANSDVKGADISSAQLCDGTWEIILNSRHRGTYALSLTYEQSMDDKAGTAAFREIEVVGARRQTGFIAIGQEKTNVEIAVLEARGASPVGGSGMPARYSDGLSFPATNFYRYSEGSAEISVKLTTHDIDPVLAARVRSCEMFSVLKDTGEIVTYMTCIVENAGRKQFLSVKLPKGASVLGAYLWGNPLKPNIAGDGTIMLPITAAAGTKCTYDVGLVWSEAAGRLGLGKELPLQAPQMDVKVDALTWDVFLPDNYGILRESGNLKLTEAPAVDASSSLYANMAVSLSESAASLWKTMPPALRMFIYFLLAAVLVCGIIYPVMKLLEILFGRMREIHLSPQVVAAVLILVAIVGGVVLLPSLSSARKSCSKPAVASQEVDYKCVEPCADTSVGINAKERTRLYQKQLDEENTQLAEEKDYLVGQKKRVAKFDMADHNESNDKSAQAPSPTLDLDTAVDDRIAALEEQINVNKALKENAKDARDLAKARGEDFEKPICDSPLNGEGWGDTVGVGGGVAGPAKPMQPGREKLPTVVNILTQSAQSEGGMFNQFSRSDNGRSKGAMPITLTFPTENTLKWRYENPSLAGGGASLKLICVSSKASMVVQSLVALLTLAGLFAFGRRNMRNAMIASGVLFTALFIAGGASDVAKNCIVVTVMWSALVALAGLGACALIQAVKNREAAVAADSR